MSNREQLLMYATVGILLVALGWIMFVKAFRDPAREYRSHASRLVLDVEKLQAEVDMKPIYLKDLNDMAGRTYGHDELHASEMARAHLVSLLTKSRINSEELRMTPVSGRRITGAREIGWVVRTKGPVDRVVDFLYLIRTDDHLHRIENLSLTRPSRSTDAEVSFKFATLVLDKVDGQKPPPITADSFRIAGDLKSKERMVYAMIASRDLLRPYIKKPPPPPPPPPKRDDPPRKNGTQKPPPPPRPKFRVVGLPSFNGKPDVIVGEAKDENAKTYKVGEDLMGGEIMMVDYRPMPMPGNPELVSNSRVIVRIGRDYFAVELGQLLDEKRKLQSDQLPTALKEKKPDVKVIPVEIEKEEVKDNPDTTAAAELSGEGTVEAKVVSKEK